MSCKAVDRKVKLSVSQFHHYPIVKNTFEACNNHNNMPFKKEKMFICVHVFFPCSFSSKPKKGIKFLQQKQLVGEEPEAVARLFYTDDRFSRASIGDYLGEMDE